MCALTRLLVFVATLLMPVAASAIPLTYRIDFTITEIVSGCEGVFPCGHGGNLGPNFSRMFTIDSALVAMPTLKNHLVALDDPIHLSGSGAQFVFFCNIERRC
jgi:hypothetical protein